jgi:hypothetical protein
MTGTFEYRLMDMNGRILLSGQGQDQVHLENLSLNPGVYWMICRNSNGNTVTQKLISF